MSGGGGGRAGNATYSQYLAYALQKILREDERTRNLTFRLQANIWLTASGRSRASSSPSPAAMRTSTPAWWRPCARCLRWTNVRRPRSACPSAPR